VNTILNAPGIERDAAGRPVASTEVIAWLTPDGDSPAVGFVARGVRTAVPTIHPGFRVVSGRPFRPGARELIVGIGLQRVFGMRVGGSIVMPDGPWPIVGVYRADGNIIESDLMADADTLMSTMRMTRFNSVLVRLRTAGSLEVFGRWLADNPGLGVSAERQSDFNRRDTTYNRKFFNSIAALVGLTMAVGALFGTVKILYALVRTRSREIATLRALGYDAASVAAAVVAQSIALCVSGAARGSRGCCSTAGSPGTTTTSSIWPFRRA
jgi:putative ABC transport system permease protein